MNYSEFLAATIDFKSGITESQLLELYNQFDTDHTGVITKDNIVAAMGKVGHTITQEELDGIM